MLIRGQTLAKFSFNRCGTYFNFSTMYFPSTVAELDFHHSEITMVKIKYHHCIFEKTFFSEMYCNFLKEECGLRFTIAEKHPDPSSFSVTLLNDKL